MASIKGWEKIKTVKGYTFWERKERGDTPGMVRESELSIYNVTEDGLPPRTTGGYFDIQYLCRMKRVSI
jgi:hypothetical protein